MANEEITPIAVTIPQAVKISGIGRTTLYSLAKEKKLALRKVRGRTLVLVEDLHRLILSEAA